MASENVRVHHLLECKVVWLLAMLLLVTSAAFSQEKLETAQDTNERIHQLAAALPVKQSDYVIGTGDLLHIEVFDVPELSREVRVGSSGYISLPLLPAKVRTSGLTAFQLEEKLAELLQANGLVSHPQVTVFIKEQRSQPITVTGAVTHPFVYQAIRPTTLLEVLTEAGGIAADAGGTVIVTRTATEVPAGEAEGSGNSGTASSPPMTITISLNDLLESADMKFNIPLVGGDVVTVPRAGVVYVVGAVDKPGGFVLASDREQMTTLKVLALAGGLRSTAKPRQAVILRKNSDTGQRQEVPVDVSKILERKAEDVRLQANDILFVPDSTGKKALRRTGEIALGLASGVALFRLSR
ncbi:MAG TPA: polysaccharide biosynthesis/export family protein [Candidatus Acidoferrales bacterium]|nr:polysaccharide biosynthesis/export family protein [Candidatus Acidoferrales bacterium]